MAKHSQRAARIVAVGKLPCGGTRERGYAVLGVAGLPLDASAMTETLKGAGFDVVESRRDLKIAEMRRFFNPRGRRSAKFLERELEPAAAALGMHVSQKLSHSRSASWPQIDLPSYLRAVSA